MSSTYLSMPGEKFGPCKKACKHRDCAQTRKMAETPCRICSEPIGYDRHFYQEQDWKVLVHEVCLVEEIEAERMNLDELAKHIQEDVS